MFYLFDCNLSRLSVCLLGRAAECVINVKMWIVNVNEMRLSNPICSQLATVWYWSIRLLKFSQQLSLDKFPFKFPFHQNTKMMELLLYVGCEVRRRHQRDYLTIFNCVESSRLFRARAKLASLAHKSSFLFAVHQVACAVCSVWSIVATVPWPVGMDQTHPVLVAVINFISTHFLLSFSFWLRPTVNDQCCCERSI